MREHETPAEREERAIAAKLDAIWERYRRGETGQDAVRRELGRIWPGHPGIYSHEWWPYAIEVVFDDPDTRGWRYRVESDFRLRRSYVTVWFGPVA